MIPGLEEELLAYARQHDLHRFDVGMMKMPGYDLYVATVWWHPVHFENSCSIGHGDSVIDAFGKAIDEADRIRAEARIAAQNEQPLPVYVPVLSSEGAAA